jgi:hypothetical protein
MDYVLTKDPSGVGSWVLMVGCPWIQSHQLHDEEGKVSGPTFAFCANCPHQVGKHFEFRESEMDWTAQVHPERLECGYKGE